MGLCETEQIHVAMSFFFSLLKEVPIRKLRFMKPNIANCYGKNEKGIGACNMSRYAKFDYNRKKNIFFLLPR